MDEFDEQWSFTVIRTHGLSFLRPERSWRPIVTVAVDEHEHHEVQLGNGGQNPNLRAPFYLQDVHVGSKVDIGVWHSPQSKKKPKRKKLVATACHSLGELVKKHDSTTKAEIRLNCQLPQKKGSASKGRPQNGAFVVIRVCPPESFVKSSMTEDDEPDSDGFRTPPSPTSDRTVSDSQSEEEGPPRIEENMARIRGYLSSDSETLDNGYDSERKPLIEDLNPGEESDNESYDDEGVTIRVTSESPYWLFPSLLPSYTEKIEVDSSSSIAERALSSFTMYSELKEATLDSHFEGVFTRLQQEWTYVGGLLVALAAVDTAVFSMSTGPGSLFNVDAFAQRAVAASSIASGVGISCDAWFLLRYNWADVHTFRTRARDLFGSYFFFSLSARLPSFSMLLSALSLMVFLGRVAFHAWPEAVIVVCVLFGIIMSLQFLVFGAQWCVRRISDGSRVTFRRAARIFGAPPSPGAPPPYESK